MSKIEITLTAQNMGPDHSEADFDAWTSYVCEHIDDAVGFEVHEVAQFSFDGGPATDRVDGASVDQVEAIRNYLAHEGWDAFCADASAWPKAAE